jgi:moderate conductance mechanosensitive channel
MIRLILLMCILGLSAPSLAAAQKQGGATAPAPSLPADQAKTALDVLNDPAKRAAVAATLNAIIKAQPAPSASAEPAKPPPAETAVEGLSIPLAPDSLGAQILLSASVFVNNVGNQAMDALETVQSLPLLYGWVVVMATNPIARSLLLDVTWRIALVLACAAAVEFGLRRAMQRPIRGLEVLAPHHRQAEADAARDQNAVQDAGIERAEAGEVEPPSLRRHRPSAWTLLNRVPLVLARLLLELVPVLGIVVVGHLIAASSLGGQTVSRLIILAIVDAYAICTALLCVARMLLSPEASRLRLFHLNDEAAAYLMRWIRRLILIAVLGYAIGEVGLLLGLSDLAHDAMQKAIGLALHLCIAVMVIQNRLMIGQWLRAPEGAGGVLATLRNRVATIWHWIALFFLVAGWLAWAVEVPHGYTAVLHYFFVTALVLIGARLVLLLLLGLVDRVMRPTPGDASALASALYPGVHARLSMYHPAVTLALRLTVYLMCVLGLLQLYGLNTFIWLVSSALGLRLVSASATLLLTIVLAFAVWETVNAGFQQYLGRLQREAQLAKSARLRTLLPLLRTTLLITIAIVAGLMVLSEIGINIAPLLAGAGIVGVAIGFGSQKLVQDLITGIFLLLENAMQVGDTVTVSGLTGVVEALSVRTIRLRAGDGSVHIIPFSSVTSVTNVNRGLGNAAIAVSVAFDEDTDRVAEELQAIATSMRGDPDMSAKMLSDFQLWGVDKVDGASVTVAGQLVCTDSGRWAVQREFNRRMKRRFQELGIRMFNPLQTITVATTVRAPAETGEDHGHAQAAD